MAKSISVEQKKDVVGRMLLHEDSDLYLDFVYDHQVQLEKLGLLEVAFVVAWIATSHTNYRWNVAGLEEVLNLCFDRDLLLAAGDRLPEGEAFTIYRGVSGKGRFRRVRGLAWTASLDTACWFAMRYAKEDARFADPAVYKATVQRDNVFFYTNGRGEQEFVCRPKRCQRLPLSLTEMKRYAAKGKAEMKRHEAKRLAAMQAEMNKG